MLPLMLVYQGILQKISKGKAPGDDDGGGDDEEEEGGDEEEGGGLLDFDVGKMAEELMEKATEKVEALGGPVKDFVDDKLGGVADAYKGAFEEIIMNSLDEGGDMVELLQEAQIAGMMAARDEVVGLANNAQQGAKGSQAAAKKASVKELKSRAKAAAGGEAAEVADLVREKLEGAVDEVKAKIQEMAASFIEGNLVPPVMKEIQFGMPVPQKIVDDVTAFCVGKLVAKIEGMIDRLFAVIQERAMAGAMLAGRKGVAEARAAAGV